jgi:predicted transcriptional regulator
VVKTTVYLPEDLKRRLEALARTRETSEAALIREAVEQLVAQSRPRLGLFRSGDPTLAERVDEELAKGFGLD